jgi:hypothetical protein
MAGELTFGNRGGETADSRVLVIKHFEDAINFRELYDVLNPRRKFHQFQLSAATSGRGVSRHQFAQPAAVDVEDLGHVEENLLVSIFERRLDQVAQSLGALPEGDRALQMQDEYIANFPIEMFQRHSIDASAPQPVCQMIEFGMPDRSVTRREANQILGAAAATPLLAAQSPGLAAQSPVSAAQSPDVCFLTAIEMADMIRRKKLSAREVMGAHL